MENWLSYLEILGIAPGWSRLEREWEEMMKRGQVGTDYFFKEH